MKKIKDILVNNNLGKTCFFSIFSNEEKSMNNYIRSIMNSEENSYINNMFKQQRIKACKNRIH